MKCHKCGKETMVLVCLPGFRRVCQTCHMHLFPFKMELTYTRSHHYLYNRTLEIPETLMTIERYINCDWFQRRRVLQGNYIHYTLEYHGKVKCSRCVNYDNWPLSMDRECKLYKMCRWDINKHSNATGGLAG